jgi:hypothetical protein
MEPSPLLLRSILAYYQPKMMMDYDECRAVGGIIGRGNRSIRIKPDPVPLFQTQIIYHLPRARTRAVAVGNRRLTA